MATDFTEVVIFCKQAGLWRKQARRPVTAPPGIAIKENRVDVATIKVIR